MTRNEITKIMIPEDKNSICRFCLESSNDFIIVNDYSEMIEWPKAGNLTIREVFTKLSIKLDDAEYLPNGICSHCKNCLEDCFMFLEKIENNEEILRKVYSEDASSHSEGDDYSNLSFEDTNGSFNLNFSENISDNIIKVEHAYVQTKQVHQDEESADNRIENTVNEITENSVSTGDRMEILVIKPGISDQKEEKPFHNDSSSETNCVRIDTELGQNERNDDSRSTSEVKDNFVKYNYRLKFEEDDESVCIKQCFFCDKKFSNDDLKILHYVEHVVQATAGMVTQRLFCTYCGLLANTKEELDEHINSKHDNEEYSNCLSCNIKFSNVGELSNHVKKQHIEDFEEEIDTDIKCLICKRKFEDSDQMMKHSLEHLTRRHTCISCKNIYICSAALNEHHKTHPQYKHKCPICKKLVCNGRNALEKHIETHTTTRRFECQICRRKYKTKALFNNHMQCHTRPANICPHCAYSTRSITDFNIHLRIHSNERPFKCTFRDCGKAYKTNSALSSHVKEHLKIRKFSCEFCDYKTSRSVGLTIHRRRHTGEKPYTCKKCGKNFNRHWSLNIHKKKVHSE